MTESLPKSELDRSTGWVSSLERILAQVSVAIVSVVIIVMVFHIVSEAVIRLSGFPSPLNTITFVSAWYMVAIVFPSMPVAYRSAGLLRVEILLLALPQRVRAFLEIVSSLILLAYVVLLDIISIQEALKKTADGEMWASGAGYLLVWPSRWLLPFGFSVLLLSCLIHIYRQVSSPHTEALPNG